MENCDLEGLPNNAREAKRLGLRFYYNGNPCKRGHISKRLTANSNCEQCRKENQTGGDNSDLNTRDLVFSEAGLLAAVKNCKTRHQRINAMIKYYYNCMGQTCDNRVKEFITDSIQNLKAKLATETPKPMYNKCPGRFGKAT